MRNQKTPNSLHVPFLDFGAVHIHVHTRVHVDQIGNCSSDLAPFNRPTTVEKITSLKKSVRLQH